MIVIWLCKSFDLCLLTSPSTAGEEWCIFVRSLVCRQSKRHERTNCSRTWEYTYFMKEVVAAMPSTKMPSKKSATDLHPHRYAPYASCNMSHFTQQHRSNALSREPNPLTMALRPQSGRVERSRSNEALTSRTRVARPTPRIRDRDATEEGCGSGSKRGTKQKASHNRDSALPSAISVSPGLSKPPRSAAHHTELADSHQVAFSQLHDRTRGCQSDSPGPQLTPPMSWSPCALTNLLDMADEPSLLDVDLSALDTVHADPSTPPGRNLSRATSLSPCDFETQVPYLGTPLQDVDLSALGNVSVTPKPTTVNSPMVMTPWSQSIQDSFVGFQTPLRNVRLLVPPDSPSVSSDHTRLPPRFPSEEDQKSVIARRYGRPVQSCTLPSSPTTPWTALIAASSSCTPLQDMDLSGLEQHAVEYFPESPTQSGIGYNTDRGL